MDKDRERVDEIARQLKELSDIWKKRRTESIGFIFWGCGGISSVIFLTIFCFWKYDWLVGLAAMVVCFVIWVIPLIIAQIHDDKMKKTTESELLVFKEKNNLGWMEIHKISCNHMLGIEKMIEPYLTREEMNILDEMEKARMEEVNARNSKNIKKWVEDHQVDGLERIKTCVYAVSITKSSSDSTIEVEIIYACRHRIAGKGGDMISFVDFSSYTDKFTLNGFAYRLPVTSVGCKTCEGCQQYRKRDKSLPV